MLSAFPVSMLGWNPLDYTNTTSMLRTGIFIALFFVIAAAIGLWWNPMLWLQNAFVFYAIFTVFYTTFFHQRGRLLHRHGRLAGLLAVAARRRTRQPAALLLRLDPDADLRISGVLGTLLAVYFGIRYTRFSTLPGIAPAHAPLHRTR